MKSLDKKKRLAEAMKQNIIRRKEHSNEFDEIKNRISNFKSVDNKLKTKNNINTSQIFTCVVDLFAGGFAGFIVGLICSNLFNLQTHTLKIVFIAIGIMGGLYNIFRFEFYIKSKN